MSRTTVWVRGVALNVDVRRAGDGPPLLLCNGIGANLELLEPLVDGLAGQPGRLVPTIRFDVPGTGGSPTTWLPRRMPGLARGFAQLGGRLCFDEVGRA